MKVLYFAWLRQKIGVGEEVLSPPDNVTTPAQLIDWLRSQGPGYERAFSDIRAVKVAVNQEFSEFDTPIKPNDEVAFFPPVTGG